MKGIIVFKGKYGATMQYAKWLSESLELPAFSADIANEADIRNADYIILGSSVYIGKLQLRKWLIRYASELEGKKLFLFIVCGTPAHEKEKIQGYIDNSVPVNIRFHCKLFILPGRMMYDKLSVMDKLLLRVGARMTADLKTRKTMLTDYDSVKKEEIQPLINEVKFLVRKKQLASQGPIVKR